MQEAIKWLLGMYPQFSDEQAREIVMGVAERLSDGAETGRLQDQEGA